MIQAKDLRTSNLIYRLGNVSEVDWSTIKLCAQRNKQFNEDWKPIPLTPEWLERFGFVHSENWNASWMFKGNFGVNNHSGVWNWNDLSQSVKVPYVHSLQNLYFALTGKELTLTGQTF